MQLATQAEAKTVACVSIAEVRVRVNINLHKVSSH